MQNEIENDKPLMDEETYESYFEDGVPPNDEYEDDYYEEGDSSILDQLKDKFVYAVGVLVLIMMINEFNSFTHNKKKICGKNPYISTSECMKRVWKAHRFFE